MKILKWVFAQHKGVLFYLLNEKSKTVIYTERRRKTKPSNILAFGKRKKWTNAESVDLGHKYYDAFYIYTFYT